MMIKMIILDYTLLLYSFTRFDILHAAVHKFTETFLRLL